MSIFCSSHRNWINCWTKINLDWIDFQRNLLTFNTWQSVLYVGSWDHLTECPIFRFMGYMNVWTVVETNSKVLSLYDIFFRCPPQQFMSVIQNCYRLEDSLSGLDIEDCLKITPASEEYTTALSYLLTWRLLLCFFKNSTAEVLNILDLKIISLHKFSR